MSALSEARDHARRMAARPVYDLFPQSSGNCERGHHLGCLFGFQTCPCFCHDRERLPVPTEPERVLWMQIADEIDAYLAEPADHQDLFGDTTPEPKETPAP